MKVERFWLDHFLMETGLSSIRPLYQVKYPQLEIIRDSEKLLVALRI